jgi:hypothetical protein
MASVISAGTTSNTSLNLSGDTSGVLQLATNGSTTALTITTAQNVGIGTTSPTTQRLHISAASVSGPTNNPAGIRITDTGTNENIQLVNRSGNMLYNVETGNNYSWQINSSEIATITSNGYFKASNNGTYNNVSGLNHEFYNSANAETLIVRNANASFNSEALIVSADRNTTNNSYYFLRLNVPGVANRLLIADSGSISTAGSVQLGDAGAPPTSGVGIKFPATQSASSNANTLDDYEEGTWTPTIAAGGGYTGVTYTIQNGAYTKIGRIVQLTCYLQFSGTSNGSAIQVASLPFQLNAASSGNSGTVGYWDVTTDSGLSAWCGGSLDVIFYKIGTSTSAVSTGNVSSKFIIFSITGWV